MVETITRTDFESIASQDAYYKPTRWDLYSHVAEQVHELNPESVLELGPYKLPIVKGGDTMDRRGNPTYKHNATETPWPIDCKYDLFIACQVWEHLEGRQREAFAEVKRIAHNAILSFPYRWDCPSNPSHHGITESTIVDWTLGCVPESIDIIPGKHRRIVYRFRF